MTYTNPRYINVLSGIQAFHDDDESVSSYFGPDEKDPERAAIYQDIVDGKYGTVAAYVAPGPDPITAADVDAERDRRIATGFVFSGVAYQCDKASQQNIIAKGAQAKFAVLAGAQENDLRWNNPDKDFGWIATDNSITPMDAQTMAAMADAADQWVTAHIMAARTIKDQDPVPADYADDSHWPAAS